MYYDREIESHLENISDLLTYYQKLIKALISEDWRLTIEGSLAVKKKGGTTYKTNQLPKFTVKFQWFYLECANVVIFMISLCEVSF